MASCRRARIAVAWPASRTEANGCPYRTAPKKMLGAKKRRSEKTSRERRSSLGSNGGKNPPLEAGEPSRDEQFHHALSVLESRNHRRRRGVPVARAGALAA